MKAVNYFRSKSNLKCLAGSECFLNQTLGAL